MLSKDTQHKLQLRRAIASSAFIMLLLVAVIGLFSLFSIWSINRAWTAGAEEMAELQALTRSSLDALVNFKVQVQEWKNILLRGDDPALLEKYLAAFRQRSNETERGIDHIAKEASRIGIPATAENAGAVLEAHRILSARYEEALRTARPQSAVLTADQARSLDRSLRGIDRELEVGIGKLADDIAELADEKRVDLAVRMQVRYRALRWFILGVIALSLLIAGYSVSGALRVTRR